MLQETSKNKFSYFAYPDLAKQIKPDKYKNFSPYELFLLVCSALNQNFETVRTKKRTRNLVEARQIYYYFSFKFCQTTLQSIGNVTDSDHATVLHGKKQIEDLLFGNKKFSDELHKIEVFLIETINNKKPKL